MLNNERDLTDRQIEFLALRVDQVFLSVRTLNCLKNQGIERLGHLVQYSAEELMTIQNFGRKCLSEITALLAEQNLSLGLYLPEGTVREAIERSNAEIEDVREREASIELNATQKAFLAQPLSQYHFSIRLSNIIIREGLDRVGDLASIPFASGRRPNGLGRHTLEEISKFLAEKGTFLRHSYSKLG
jgi:DNA-directed RNA polymerase alpha subunit